jgi:hypothetical protein
MSEAAEYPVKDIMVTGNVSLQKNLSGKKSNQRYSYLIVIYYVHQNGMDGNQCVPTPVLRYLAADRYLAHQTL